MRKSTVKARATKLVDRAEAAAGKVADEVRAQIGDLADQVTSTTEDAYGQARRQMRGAVTMVADSFEERPLFTVLAVGLVSATLGFLLARR